MKYIIIESENKSQFIRDVNIKLDDYDLAGGMSIMDSSQSIYNKKTTYSQAMILKTEISKNKEF